MDEIIFDTIVTMITLPLVMLAVAIEHVFNGIGRRSVDRDK